MKLFNASGLEAVQYFLSLREKPSGEFQILR
jgi:hypothetical protein